MRRAAVILLSVVALAGCGGTSVDADVLAGAALQTSRAGGTEMSMRGSMKLEQLEDEIPLRGRGIVDPRTRRGHMTMDMSALATLPGGGEICGEGRCEMDIVVDGARLYMRFGKLAENLPGDAEWVRIDIDKALEGQGVNADELLQLGRDPTDQLRYLRAVSGDVEEVGEERVAGVQTTHYEGEADLRKYPDLLPPGRRATARRSVERLIELTGQDRFPMEVWIDEQRRVRRMAYEQRLKQPTGEVTIQQTIDFLRFGVPVTVDVPDDDEVVDLTGEASGLRR